MGFYTSTSLLTEAGEGDIKIPLDPEDDGFRSIDPLEDHEGDAAGMIDPDPIVSVGEAYIVMAECETNWNLIMKEAGIRELREYANTGRDMIYESVDIKGFFRKAKEMFLNLIKRIASILKAWLAKIESMVRSGKAFANKYASDIKEGATKLKSDFKFKGYHYAHLSTEQKESDGAGWDVDKAYTAMTAKTKLPTVESVKTSLDVVSADGGVAGEQYQEALDEARGNALNGSTAISAADFASTIFEYFHGSKEKVSFGKGDVNTADIIAHLTGAADIRKSAKEAYRKIEKKINETIRGLNTLERSLKGEDTKPENNSTQSHKISMATLAIRTNKDMVNILHSVYVGYISASKSYSNQCRSLAASCIAANKKYVKPGSTTTESTFMGINLL